MNQPMLYDELLSEYKSQLVKYNTLIDTSPDGIMILKSIRDESGKIVDFLISTCNRVEFYLAAEEQAAALAAVEQFLSTRTASTDREHFFQHPTPQSVRHLFRVASGLDSMVLGETEILGQVKKAYAAAQAAGATAKHLNKLFPFVFIRLQQHF